MRTRVGYAGGTTPDPTYHRLGDHTETFQVDFDPSRISYQELLDVFWSSHSPCGNVWSTQYQAIVFYQNAEQKKVAEASRERQKKLLRRPITTQVRKLDTFYLAEDYHQKHALRRNRRLTQELLALDPSDHALVKSTAAAKVNAYLDGHLAYPALRKDLERLGLRAVGERELEHVERLPKDHLPEAEHR